MPFYNTIHLSGEELAKAVQSADSQETIILRFLEANHGNWSAWDLHRQPNFYHLPITSIRRALHNLLDRGQIVESGMIKGVYGKPVHTYTTTQINPHLTAQN